MTTNKQIEKELEKNRKDYQKHNKLKWTLKQELEFLTINELLEIKKLIVSLYDKEVKQEELTKSFTRNNDNK